MSSPEQLPARRLVATPINFAEADPVEQIKDIHGGGDKAIDAVGYQAIDPAKEGDGAYNPARENPAVVTNDLIRTVRATGELGIPGLYVPDDPGAPDEMATQSRLGIDFGLLFEKGQALGTGQCNVREYNRELRDMIIEGHADPSWVVSHRVALDDAPEMYEKFDNREEGVTKVLLEPYVPPPPAFGGIGGAMHTRGATTLTPRAPMQRGRQNEVTSPNGRLRRTRVSRVGPRVVDDPMNGTGKEKTRTELSRPQ